MDRQVTLLDVEIIGHERYLKSQRLYRFIVSRKFESAWSLAGKHERRLLKEKVLTGDINIVKSFVETLLRKEISTWSTKNLRELASIYGIPYYSELDRETLLKNIMEIKNENHSNTCQESVNSL